MGKLIGSGGARSGAFAGGGRAHLSIQRGHAAHETANLLRRQVGPPGFDVNLQAVGQRDAAPYLDGTSGQSPGWRILGRAGDQFAYTFEAQACIAPAANSQQLLEMPAQVVRAALLARWSIEQPLADDRRARIPGVRVPRSAAE